MEWLVGGMCYDDTLEYEYTKLQSFRDVIQSICRSTLAPKVINIVKSQEIGWAVKTVLEERAGGLRGR